MIIKILLVGAILAAVAIALRGSRSSAFLALRRLGTVAFAAAAVGAILFPNALTWVANKVGVGRGADLVLYVFAVLFVLVTVALYQRIRHLEDRITELTRAVALRNVEKKPE